MSLAAEIAKEFSPDLLPAIIEQLSDEEQEELYGHLEADEHDSIIARCSERVVAHDRGPMYWLRNWTRTENFHWQTQGRTRPDEPFPYKPYPKEFLASYGIEAERLDWDYLDWVMDALLESFERGKELRIPKTREMITSWLVVGYITWSCQFFPSIEAVGQSENDRKAQGLIEYANTLYRNQPDWMKARFPLKRASADEGGKHSIEWTHRGVDEQRQPVVRHSKFFAVPQGVRQTASSHPTIYFNDESAHQPAWKTTIGVVRQATKQIISVSSAAPSDFGDACQIPGAQNEGNGV
jgi:hypothetical protein